MLQRLLSLNYHVNVNVQWLEILPNLLNNSSNIKTFPSHPIKKAEIQGQKAEIQGYTKHLLFLYFVCNIKYILNKCINDIFRFYLIFNI